MNSLLPELRYSGAEAGNEFKTNKRMDVSLTRVFGLAET